MAMRILASRLVSSNLTPLRVCVAPMSTKSGKSTEVSTRPRSEKESWRSYFASIFGGKVDPADPNAPPIDASEVNFPDVTEKATGEEKLFLLAFENGILDPYCNLPVDRNGAGTKDNPVIVEGFLDSRTVACVCEPTQNYVKYMVVNKGEPKRCYCGHWVKLVDGPKFWQKIPKEDLLQIAYFRDLEEEGKLDDLLAGKEDEGKKSISHH